MKVNSSIVALCVTIFVTGVTAALILRPASVTHTSQEATVVASPTPIKRNTDLVSKKKLSDHLQNALVKIVCHGPHDIVIINSLVPADDGSKFKAEFTSINYVKQKDAKGVSQVYLHENGPTPLYIVRNDFGEWNVEANPQIELDLKDDL